MQGVWEENLCPERQASCVRDCWVLVLVGPWRAACALRIIIDPSIVRDIEKVGPYILRHRGC